MDVKSLIDSPQTTQVNDGQSVGDTVPNTVGSLGAVGKSAGSQREADALVDRPFELAAGPRAGSPAQNARIIGAASGIPRKAGPESAGSPALTPDCRAHLPPLDGPVRPWGPEDRQPWADEQPPLEDEAEQAAADANLPKQSADRCWICLGTIFWEDIAGALHCAECEQIPVRAFASGGCWRVVQGLGDEPHRWEDYTPVGWQPFAHLEAGEQQALMGTPDEDF